MMVFFVTILIVSNILLIINTLHQKTAFVTVTNNAPDLWYTTFYLYVHNPTFYYIYSNYFIYYFISYFSHNSIKY